MPQVAPFVQALQLPMQLSQLLEAPFPQVPPGQVARQLVPLRKVPEVQEVHAVALEQVAHGLLQLSQLLVAPLPQRPAGQLVTQLELCR